MKVEFAGALRPIVTRGDWPEDLVVGRSGHQKLLKNPSENFPCPGSRTHPCDQ